MHGLIAWQCHTTCIFGVDDRVVSEFAERCGNDSLAETLVGDIRDVVDDESFLACGCLFLVVAIAVDDL